MNRPRPETPADLVEHNCILYTDSGYGNRWPIFDSPEEITVKGNLQTNTPLVLLSAAETGQGIVVLPRFLAADALVSGRLIELLREHTTLRKPIYAIYPHRLLPAKAAVFVDMVAAHLQRALAPARSEPPRRSVGMTYRGLRQGSPDVIARVEKGEAIDPADYSFRIAPFFETAAPPYAWLNNVVSSGSLRHALQQTRLRSGDAFLVGHIHPPQR